MTRRTRQRGRQWTRSQIEAEGSKTILLASMCEADPLKNEAGEPYVKCDNDNLDLCLRLERDIPLLAIDALTFGKDRLVQNIAAMNAGTEMAFHSMRASNEMRTTNQPTHSMKRVIELADQDQQSTIHELFVQPDEDVIQLMCEGRERRAWDHFGLAEGIKTNELKEYMSCIERLPLSARWKRVQQTPHVGMKRYTPHLKKITEVALMAFRSIDEDVNFFGENRRRIGMNAFWKLDEYQSYEASYQIIKPLVPALVTRAMLGQNPASHKSALSVFQEVLIAMTETAPEKSATPYVDAREAIDFKVLDLP